MRANKCFKCGKPAIFETWQYFDIDLRKHIICGWCSKTCLAFCEKNCDGCGQHRTVRCAGNGRNGRRI